MNIFAIGACYETFSDQEPCGTSQVVSQHQHYCSQALQISLITLAAYLRNAFIYLRLVSQISESKIAFAKPLMLKAWSSCWTTLGLTARLAQSIGLQVKDAARTPEDNSNTFSYELRRRTWYSIYVFDRLLALQLGRPPAIYEGDFNVGLPSRLDDTAMSDAVHTSSQAGNEGSLAGDYFIAVIQFS